jgi:hypothetical protein
MRLYGRNKIPRDMKNIFQKSSTVSCEVKSPLDSNKENVFAKFQPPITGFTPMKKTFALRAIIAVMLVSVFAFRSSGAPALTDVYGNLGTMNLDSTSNTVGYLSLAQPNQFQAQGFTTHSSAWNIQQILVGLGASGSPSPVVKIYSDSAGAPGSHLATFNGTASVSTKGIYTFTGSFTALQNTGYWVVLENAKFKASYSDDERKQVATLIANAVDKFNEKVNETSRVEAAPEIVDEAATQPKPTLQALLHKKLNAEWFKQLGLETKWNQAARNAARENVLKYLEPIHRRDIHNGHAQRPVHTSS